MRTHGLVRRLSGFFSIHFKLLRTNTLHLLPPRRQRKLLKAILVHSSAIWNLGNSQKRQALLQKSSIPAGFPLVKTLKPHPISKVLGSAYSQQILNKLQEAWSAFFGALKSKKGAHQVGLPKYFKNRQTNQTSPVLVFCRNDCYKLDKNSIFISCPTDLKQNYHLKGLLRIKYNGILKWVRKQGKLEIQYFPVLKEFYAYQSVKITPLPIKPNPTNISSGDIGIKRYLVNYI
ncbi:MAG: hypothetical protein ACFFD2_16885 [Promethearchaeota archaeon]